MDNQSEYDATYPKTLCCQPPANGKEARPFLSFVMEDNLINNQSIINSVRLCILPMYVFLTDALLEKYLSFVSFALPLKSSQKSYVLAQAVAWDNQKIKTQRLLMIIRKLEFYPISLTLSLKLEPSQVLPEEQQYLPKMLRAVGVVMCSIENITFKLNGIQLHDMIDTQNSLAKKIKKRYKEQLYSQLWQILGSINLIGNPLSLIKNIKSGVTDLFEMPAQGFVEGPLEGFGGIVSGVGSLAKKTF